MKRSEFIECCKLAADSHQDLPGYLSVEVVELFDALNSNLRAVSTKATFAGAIRGQAQPIFGGDLLQSEVKVMEDLSRRVDLIG